MLATKEQLRNIVTTNKRYKNFIILDEPRSVSHLLLGKDYELVQCHSIEIITDDSDAPDIIGFCGAFSWHDHNIAPLDGDTYDPNMTVYGYCQFSTGDYNQIPALDILVGDDW